jgi:hypothetical protein
MAAAETQNLLHKSTPPSPGGGAKTLRHAVYNVLEGCGRAAFTWECITVALICINVGSFLASTDASIAKHHQQALDCIEIVTVGVFTLEYLLRFWAIVETPGGVSCAISAVDESTSFWLCMTVIVRAVGAAAVLGRQHT